MAKVPFYVDWLGAGLDKFPTTLQKLGNLETKLLKYDINTLKIEKPVFICGMARGGSTILLEFLNNHKDFCSYQYGDYPYLHANYFWNTLKILTPSGDKKVERAHKDRIFVNAKSPESLDEILWMHFFKDIHKTEISNILDGATENPDFEAFYKDSLLKLMALRKAPRIAFKNNYHSARILYLKKLFPDARFIIPFRNPVDHIFSLIKQHKFISAEQDNDPRAGRYMRRNGHFEFGNDYRPVNFGNTAKTNDILKSFENGKIVETYAKSWNETYSYILKLIESEASLKENISVVHYDALLEAPKETLQALQNFVDVEDQELLETFSGTIRKPDYYKNDFTNEDIKTIETITSKTVYAYKKL